MSQFKVFVTRRIPQVGIDLLKEIAEVEIGPKTTRFRGGRRGRAKNLVNRVNWFPGREISYAS